MAEIFKNFSSGMPVVGYGVSNINKTIVVVPYASGSTNKEGGYGWESSRKEQTVAQIHSIYISCRSISGAKIYGVDRYNPKFFSAFNLYIEKRNSNTTTDKSYIVYDGRIVVGAPFFIEKNITLESDQRLVLECPDNSYDLDTDTNDPVQLNTNSDIIIEISASTVLLPDTEQSAN